MKLAGGAVQNRTAVQPGTPQRQLHFATASYACGDTNRRQQGISPTFYLI